MLSQNNQQFIDAMFHRIIFSLVFVVASSFVATNLPAQSGSLNGSTNLRHPNGRSMKMAEVSPLYRKAPRQRVHQPQDIVYVNVKSDWGYTTTADLRKRKQVESEARLTYWFKLPRLLVGMPTASEASLPEIGGEIDSQTQNNGQLQRKETLNFKVACKITSIEPNGNLVIEGTHKIQVDEELKIMFVGGTVQPEYLVNNTIDSSMVADLDIKNYTGGVVPDTVRRPWGQQLFDKVKPF